MRRFYLTCLNAKLTMKALVATQSMNNNTSHAKPKPANSSDTQMALNAYLVSADTLSREGRYVEAELRLTEALALAQNKCGQHSDQVVLVLSILAAFYRSSGKLHEALRIEERISSWSPDENKTPDKPAVQGPLSSKLAAQTSSSKSEADDKAKILPHNVRRACRILGLPTDEKFSADQVQRAWKKQMLQQGAHPDLGGNTDEAVLLNQAKTELLEYLEFVTPRQRSSWKTGTR
jgi:hypothetical protein